MLKPDLRLSRGGGVGLSPPLLRSRWVEFPEGVEELPANSLAPGFAAAGVCAGIKRSGKEDVGLLLCRSPQPASAAFFTANAAAAAPVMVSRKRCALERLRAVVVNSGCANAATGQPGVADAEAMQAKGAAVLGLAVEEVAVCSTGTIGDRLPLPKVLAGIEEAARSLGGDAATFQRAIETTDAFPKQVAVACQLEGRQVVVTAQCKGAGMISPRFATMLCFLETDAAIEPALFSELVGRAVERSFGRISVDGQLSTNDTVVAIASGASGVVVAAGSPAAERFSSLLDAVLLQLALLVVKDGEGSKRIGRVVVEAESGGEAEAVARAVANSPLVKAALYGGDPNWGRILQAAGQALAGSGERPISVAIEGVEVCRAGEAVAVPQPGLEEAVSGEEVEYLVRVGEGNGGYAELYFSDLSHTYVTINAEYRT